MKNSKKVLMNITLLEEFRRKDEGSYLDCFMPLICSCLIEDDGDSIDYNKLHTIFSKNFVTNIPKHAMKAILRRAKQKDYLIQDGAIWTKNVELIQKAHSKFKTASKKIELAQEEIVKSFQAFAKAKYRKVVSESDFLDAFTLYMQKHFMDYLKLDIIETRLSDKDHTQDMEYLMSVFLKEKWLETKEVPEFIQTNIQGFYLANYIGYFDNNLHERLKSFKVYLDTPIIMGLLGWNGKTASKYQLELIDGLKKQEVSFFAFENTLDEVKGVLRGYSKAIRNQNWQSFNHSTLRYIRNNLITVESIERDIIILENTLKSSGIKIMPSPERNPTYQMDEATFRKTLVSLGYDEFKQHTDMDVDYIAAIHQLREGRFIDHNAQSVPVYYTSNTLLINTCINFFKADDDEHNSTIPHCITDSFLSSLLLLRSPSLIMGISKKKIIAEAFATIHTDNSFWQKIYNRIDILAKDKILSESDYLIFRYSTEIHAYISDQKILQNLQADDLDADKIHDLMKNFKANLTQEKDKELNEIETENRILKENQQELLVKNSALTENNVALFTKLSNTLDGRHIVKYIARGVAFLGSIAFFFALSTINYFDKFSNEISPQNASMFKYTGYSVGIIISFFCLNIKVVKNWIQDQVENKIYSYFVKVANRKR